MSTGELVAGILWLALTAGALPVILI